MRHKICPRVSEGPCKTLKFWLQGGARVPGPAGEGLGCVWGGPCPSGALRRRGAAGPGAHPHPGQGGFRQLPALKSPCHHPHRAALASQTKSQRSEAPPAPLQEPHHSAKAVPFHLPPGFSLSFFGLVLFFVFCSVFESRPPPPYFLLCLSGCLSGPPCPPAGPPGCSACRAPLFSSILAPGQR